MEKSCTTCRTLSSLGETKYTASISVNGCRFNSSFSITMCKKKKQNPSMQIFSFLCDHQGSLTRDAMLRQLRHATHRIQDLERIRIHHQHSPHKLLLVLLATASSSARRISSHSHHELIHQTRFRAKSQIAMQREWKRRCRLRRRSRSRSRSRGGGLTW